MSSDVEKVVEIDEDEIEVTGETKHAVEKEAELTQKVVPMPRPPPPFPQRLVQKTTEGKCHRFITMLKQLPINVLLMLEQMPGAISTRSFVQKKEHNGAFTIPWTISKMHFARALCDLGDNINLMPLLIYKKMGLGAPKPIAMCLLMADRTVKNPIGVLQDVLVKVESFIFSANFVILDCEVNFEVPIILGRPFLATERALVNMERGQMKLRLNKKEVTFNIYKSTKQESDLKPVSMIGVGPSGSVSTTEGAGIVDESAIDGVPRVDHAGSGKPNPPAS
ncbi:uncharacterized protein LOC125823463 [Solanum verrucosum]|uniref:uncharacterized protein LOC125823463 n=1 Tax=Solanum verrucosum TaxID=315347 RepID=UPI0020D09527|nr:uncharacterized protein LOC125823463 [Solanum verrucosum]